jgi:hypothetical protein
MTGFLLATLLAAGTPQVEPSFSLAVVAHQGVPVTNLSLGDLRRIFMGDRQFWAQDLRVTLLVPSTGSREGQLLLRRVYEKTEAQYRHYWIAKVFRAEVSAAPKVVASETLAAALLREIEGAVTVLDAGKIPPGVKVLTIDGRSPAADDYPLR